MTTHIETALREGYAHFVFFPDMGHAHLYFPADHWRKAYASAESILQSLEALYEKMLADPVLRHKYWNRNFLCRNTTTTADCAKWSWRPTPGATTPSAPLRGM